MPLREQGAKEQGAVGQNAQVFSTEESNFKRHKVSADRYFHLPNLVSQKDFHLPKRNFHLPNGSLVGALRHPGLFEGRRLFDNAVSRVGIFKGALNRGITVLKLCFLLPSIVM